MKKKMLIGDLDNVRAKRENYIELAQFIEGNFRQKSVNAMG